MMTKLILRRSRLLVMAGVLTCAFFALTSVVTCQDDGKTTAEKTPEATENKAAQPTPPLDSSHSVDFKKQIKPIFTSKCLGCHGDENQEGDLNFDDLETLTEFITAGKRNESAIYKVLVSDDEDEHMPPPFDVEAGDAEAMTPEEIELVGLWIDEGAKYELPPPPTAEEKEEAEKAKQHIAMRIWRFLGSFHPALVHFPVALFVVGAFFVVVCRRNMALANEASFYCLALGSLGAIAAAAVGWSLAFESLPFKNNENIFNMEGSMFWHRWSGVVVAVLSVIVWIVAWRQRSEDYADGGGSWKLGLVLLAGIVSLVGYQGGELVYGEDHYIKQLEKYLPEAHGAIFPEEKMDAQKGDAIEQSPDTSGGEKSANKQSDDKSTEKSSSENSTDDTAAKSGDKNSTDTKSDAGTKEETETRKSDEDIDT